MATEVIIAWAVAIGVSVIWGLALLIRPLHNKKIKGDETLDSEQKYRQIKDNNASYLVILFFLPVFLIIGTLIFASFQEDDQAAYIHYDILKGESFDYLMEIESVVDGGTWDIWNIERLQKGYLFEMDGERVVVLVSNIKQRDGTFHHEVYRENDADYPAMMVRKQIDKKNQYFYR